MNIFLIGYRGSGKSSVAPLLAARLGWTSSDSDEQIQLLTGLTIAEIFAEQGEAGFREWEASVIAGLVRRSQQVISLGGGAIIDPENRRRIKQTGFAVWLDATADSLWKRISDDSDSPANRPALTNQGGLDEVKTLLAQRRPLYTECADYTIDTSALTPKQVADGIANWWITVDKAK